MIGGFSGVNTRLAFDTNILFHNKDEESKCQDFKIEYSMKNKGKSETKRIVSKILKMDKNNQYGNAMTKPLPYGSIKKQKVIPCIRKFNLILENMCDEDKIGHLFIGDIKFNEKLSDEMVLLFNEIYTPLLEKKKLIKPCKRSVLHLLTVLQRNKRDLNTFKFNEKTHSTMKQKKNCLFTQNICIF